MKFMYIATHGSEDPTRATLPFHMAKGAKDAGYEVEIALMGDSVVLFNDTVADSIQGVGVPPLKELRQFARDNKIPVFGWGGCCRGRGVAEEIVRKWSDTGYLDAKVLAEKVASADRVISIWVDDATQHAVVWTELSNISRSGITPRLCGCQACHFILEIAVPRAEPIKEMGMPIPNSMGIATALTFQPTGSGKAAITGDFVLAGSEVNQVIKALKENGIAVTALHSHMLDEQPRLFFMHFWANDDAVKLAKGLRAALDKTNSAKPK